MGAPTIFVHAAHVLTVEQRKVQYSAVQRERMHGGFAHLPQRGTDRPSSL